MRFRDLLTWLMLVGKIITLYLRLVLASILMKSFFQNKIVWVCLLVTLLTACAGANKGYGGKSCGCKAKAGMVGY